LNQGWKITFHVDAEGEEVRDDNDTINSGCHEAANGTREIGLTELEEGRLHVGEPAGTG